MCAVFSDQSMRCLEKAGWRVDRHVDTSRYEAVWRERGFGVGQLAIKFLSEFGGLSLRYPHFRAPSCEDGCHFIADQASANAQDWRLRQFERALGSHLTVIGEAFSDHMTLLMDEGGRVYGGFENILVRVGDSGADAINALCEGREVQTIPFEEVNEPTPRATNILSEIAVKSLSAGGWYNNRDVCIANGTRFESLPDRATDFLREFDGVSIAFPAWGNRSMWDVCQFTAEAGKSLPAGHFPEYKRRIGETAAGIGELVNARFVLLMSEDGRVFAGMRQLPDILWLIGNTGYDAINNLCAGAPRKRLL
jgi:hypothetical protein